MEISITIIVSLSYLLSFTCCFILNWAKLLLSMNFQLTFGLIHALLYHTDHITMDQNQ